MKTCPNIGGSEIKRRWFFGYAGFLLLVISIIIHLLYQFEWVVYITFLLSMAMMIPFIEAQSKTCIVNAYFGIKNMGSSYEREQDDYSLKIQRKKSIQIVIISVFFSLLITFSIYLF